MPIAIGSKVSIATDIHLADASGEFVAFPYPFTHAAGALHIRDGRLDIDHLAAHTGDASVVFDGNVTWPTQLHPTVPMASALTVHAKAVPIDKTLIDALPPDKAVGLKKAGLGGMLDVDGTINTDPPVGGVPTIGMNSSQLGDRLRFALDLGLRDAWLKSASGQIEADHLNGVVHLTPTGVSTQDLHGQRGPAAITGAGSIDWTGSDPIVHATGIAKGLLLDSELRQLLPRDARTAWDAVNPTGSIDADLVFNRTGIKPDYTLTLHPNHGRVRPTFFPYAMTGCTGAITVTPDRTVLDKFEGDHGPARVKISGVGLNGSTTAWDLMLSATDLNVDDELRHALPAAVTSPDRRCEFARQGVDRSHEAELSRQR